jgi:hypothetical protein
MRGYERDTEAREKAARESVSMHATDALAVPFNAMAPAVRSGRAE